MKPGIIVILRKLRIENSMLKREDLKLMQMRELFHLLRIKYFIVLRGQHGRQAALCRASHLKITEVLNAAAIFGKVDPLEDLKENEICSHLIPADTGQREFNSIIVGAKDDYDNMVSGE